MQKKKNLFAKDNIGKFLWIGIVVIIFLLQGLCDTRWRDDAVYANVLNNRTLSEFLRERYFDWSSRIVIEAVMIPLAVWNPLIWRLLNGCMMVALIALIADVFGMGEKRQARIIFSCIMLSIPVATFNNAGWIATTTNYLWALTLGMLAIRTLKNYLSDNKPKPMELLFSSLAIIYGANMEQMAAILLGAYAVTGIYMLITKRKIPWMFFVQLVLILASICFILTCPGNDVRIEQEAAQSLPIFKDLSLLDKLGTGYLMTSHYYLCGTEGSWVFVILAAVVLFSVIQHNSKTPWKWIIAGFPFFFLLLLKGIEILFQNGLWTRGLRLLEIFWRNNGVAAVTGYRGIYICLQFFLYLIIWCCILAGLYWIHGRTMETLLEYIILLAGLASRMIMGFSPTVYASGDRTALFASIAILIIAMRNLIKIKKTFKSSRLEGFSYIVGLLFFQTSEKGNSQSEDYHQRHQIRNGCCKNFAYCHQYHTDKQRGGNRIYVRDPCPYSLHIYSNKRLLRHPRTTQRHWQYRLPEMTPLLLHFPNSPAHCYR